MLSFNRETIGYSMEKGMGGVGGIKRSRGPASESIGSLSILIHLILLD